ncbi:kinesin-domain-containing protein [Cutaneotrichosporon oleaginosum]|uniref:Kinesin-domain-containing protein n=1 Tax=Cutaneotrichosporon oleaginosum TaxID=879819 RepID=A0A0J0XPH4_9TREE|nr:kinesin-domain-containing protein [Cutaneotrichosporon oleaginosum]KLT42998.1 kinesin-domain-containing protein [Cutaneotrichosporon oleaginosum]TXT11794.1 hypothetical protein COLE_02204 [Cutaneotrichosporon oleaginosum]
MAYLMDDNAMRICVRPRPWHPTKEVPYLAQDCDQPFFIGNGNFGQAKKPAGGGAIREIVEVIDNRSLDFDRKPDRTAARYGGFSGKRHKDRRYVFDHVFKMAASQEEVYASTAKPLLDGVLSGFNATVFAYGATGCGKTHTISGTQEDPGIIVRTMRDLYERISESEDRYDTHVELSMIELYNENIRDLLSDNFPQMPTGGLKLLENEKDRVTIADVTIRSPKTADEVMELVMIGNERRSTSFTAANSVSSRSHAVLQISIARKSRNPDVNVEREEVLLDTSFATLSIVDLAGSERASATRNLGDRMKEGAKINQSLLALSSCISALCDAQRKGARPHVPYRNSKLTRLLKFSLGGNCRTVMIVCVSPSSKDIEDTANTLTWADRAKHVKTTVTRNINGTHVSARQYVEKIQQLNERVKILEAQLDAKDQETSKLIQLKIEDAKKRIAEHVQFINAAVDAQCEVVREGAEHWAKWDVANLGIEKIENRRNDLEADEDTQDLARETAMCNSIIDQYKHEFTESRHLQSKVNLGNEAAIALSRQIEDLESKVFPDVDPVYAQNLRLEMAAARAKIKQANAKGCEIGYRERLAKHEDALARSAIASVRVEALYTKHAARIEALCARGPIDPSVLRQEMRLLSSLQAPLFREMGNIHQLIQMSDAPAPAPVPTPIKGAQLRHNISPGSPHVKRLSQRYSMEKKHVVHKPGSPRRSLPGRGAMRRSSAVPPVPRSARFADDEGGELAEIRHYKARSSQSPVAEASTDDGADWEEISSSAKPLHAPAPPKSKPGVSFKPHPRLNAALRAPSSNGSPTGLPRSKPPPLALTTASSPLATASAAASEIPAWKANRLALGKHEKEKDKEQVSPVKDTSVTSTVAESSFSKITIPIGLGRPSRPPSRTTSVLGELRQLPPSRPPSSLGSSTLHLPTASSAARANGDKSPISFNHSPTVPNPLRASVARRLSDRHQRRKLHQGAVPYRRKPSLIPSPKGSPNGSSPRGSTGGFGLGKSIGPGAGSAASSSGGASSSTGPSRSPMAFTMSVAGTSGAGLRTRPSLFSLNAGAVTNGHDNGANSSSAKPAWR